MPPMIQQRNEPDVNAPKVGFIAMKSPTGKVCYCDKKQSEALVAAKFKRLGVFGANGEIAYDNGVKHEVVHEVKTEVKAKAEEVKEDDKEEVVEDNPKVAAKKERAVPGRPPK